MTPQTHLAKCARNHPNSDVAICSFNATHRLPREGLLAQLPRLLPEEGRGPRLPQGHVRAPVLGSTIYLSKASSTL